MVATFFVNCNNSLGGTFAQGPKFKYIFPFAIIIGELLVGISSKEASPFPFDLPLPFFIEVTIIFFFLNSTAAAFGSEAEI